MASADILPRVHLNVNYEQEIDSIKQFLNDKYLTQVQALTQTHSITVDLDECDAVLQQRILQNTVRYQQLFYHAINQIQPPTNDSDEPVDIILKQRRAIQPDIALPMDLECKYQVHFKPPSVQKQLKVRDAKANQIGQLISIHALVTRVSEVKPQLIVATYTCQECQFEIFQEVSATAHEFLPLSQCPSERCQQQKSKGELTLQIRASKFRRFQELKIQELTHQVPMGHIPRSMTVYLSGDLCRQVGPGDEILVAGVFLPRVYKGFRQIKAGLLTDVYLQAEYIENKRGSYNSALSGAYDLAADVMDYQTLAQSIAPEIYGHLDVKKAILLLMTGAVSKHVSDGMKIRGDLNVLLMGDPGVAKSQLLKWVSRVVPRGVYTTGKGSSGVGLTAAVLKDPTTGEMILEGGSLVLADNGVCCIDEFDKMEETDRTAIHEVMEQQTISISKAGINTTLNARVSILAAANPVNSRYNRNKSLEENINLPPALFSRFDLLFLLLDTQSVESDSRMAEHILGVHRGSTNHAEDTQRIKQYIARARQFEPELTQTSQDYIVGAYIQKRQEQQAYTQPRTLLAILRMSQALARLRFSQTIDEEDIKEALRLMDIAKQSVQVQPVKRRDPVTRIYMELCKMKEGANNQVDLDHLRERLRVSGGYDEKDLEECISKYEDLNVFARVGETIVFI